MARFTEYCSVYTLHFSVNRLFFADFSGTRSRYSSTSVYTELRAGKRDDDDGSRLLSIENHLGVPATVTLEENSGEESPTEKYLKRRKAKEYVF